MFGFIRTLMLVSVAAVPMLAACDFNEGPVERAGEKIDRAAERTGDAIEDAAD
jgi:hypothetical protein